MLNRFLFGIAGVAVIASTALTAQQAAPPAPESGATASFEAVAIRPNNSNEERGRMRLQPGGRLEVVNMPIWHLVTFAYPMEGYYRHFGGPEWLNRDRFDIVAKLEGDPRQLPAAVRTLLADHFQLKQHREERDTEVYELVLSKPAAGSSATLKPSALDCSPEAATRGGPICRVQLSLGRLKSGGGSMKQLANSLAAQVGRVVIDKTGMTGRFDFEMTFAPEPPTIALPPVSDAEPPPVDAPSIFTALQETLGLKLVSARAPIEVVIIDSAERPATPK